MYKFHDKTQYDYNEINEELLPLSNEKRLGLIAEAATLTFNKTFSKDLKVEGLYDRETCRAYFLYSGCYVDFAGQFLTDLRWDILSRAFELLETAVSNQEKATAHLEELLYNEVDGEDMAKKLSESFDIFEGLTEDEVMDKTAKHLREVLGESVEYGYDAKEREFFLNVPKYTKSVYIKHKYLRERRWDILLRAVQILETGVNEVKGKLNG